jgi:hypothetical protein
VEAIRLVELPPHHYMFYLAELFRWLEHIGVVTPSLVEVPVTVSAGEKGYLDLWLPHNTACIEREFEVYFPYTMGLRYGWMVDSVTDYTVPMHFFIPNQGSVERSVFGKHWVKWYFLRFAYEAAESGTIVVRAWARLLSHDKLMELLELSKPLAAMFRVAWPPKRVRPSPTASEVVRVCPACGAKLLRTKDGRLVRVGEWGRSYTDHECQVFR